jgi:hypothetical protein
MMSMADLLLYNEHVPAEARDAIRAAHEGPPDERVSRLRSAAVVLSEQTGLDYADVRELLGLPEEDDRE